MLFCFVLLHVLCIECLLCHVELFCAFCLLYCPVLCVVLFALPLLYIVLFCALFSLLCCMFIVLLCVVLHIGLRVIFSFCVFTELFMFGFMRNFLLCHLCVTLLLCVLIGLILFYYIQ